MFYLCAHSTNSLPYSSVICLIDTEMNEVNICHDIVYFKFPALQYPYLKDLYVLMYYLPMNDYAAAFLE